jgi:hypothetical protein
MFGQSKEFKNWRRTRRNVLTIGGVLAGAALSRINRASALGVWREDWLRHRNDHGPSCFLRNTRILTA